MGHASSPTTSRGTPARTTTLPHIIHERFCCNRRFAAATSLRRTGSPFAPSTYCWGLASARWSRTRLRDFATNRHK